MTGATRRTPPRLGWLYHWMMGFIGLFDRWLHLSCRAFARLASEKLERPLTRGERLRQAVHRAICHLCRLYERRLEQVHALSLELGRSPEVASTAELTSESVERMRRALRSASGGARE